MACTVSLLAPRVGTRLPLHPGKPQTRPNKAKSSIVRRLRGLSSWFEPPIPRFRRQAGVAMGRRGGKNRIRFASVRSFGRRNRRSLFALSGDGGRQHELKYRAAFGTGRYLEAAVVALDDRPANRQAHAHAVGFG